GAAAFVLDTTSGRSLRLGLERGSALSSDGRSVAWVEEPPFWRHERTTELQLARLEGEGFASETLELGTPLAAGGIHALALSSRANRLAVVQNTTLSLYEIPSGRMISTTAATDGEWMAAAFVEDGQLRAFRRVRTALAAPGQGIVPGRIEVVSMRGGVPESAVRLDALGQAFLVSPAGGDLVLLQEPMAPSRFSLHDVRSGRRLRTF